MSAELRRLSLPSLEWLADRAPAVSDGSPLRFLSSLGRASTPAEREKAAAEEGLSAGGSVSDGWREAIEILACPDVQVGAVFVQPGVSSGAAFYARGGRALRYHLDRDGCEIGSPVDVESLVVTLAALLVAPAPQGGAEVILSPSVLGVLTLLWPLSDRDVSMAIPRDEALKRLGPSPAAAAKAPGLLAELVRKQMLRAANGELTVHPRWRPWLEAAWSGHVLQLSGIGLFPVAPGTKAPTKHLLITGPPGRRVRSRHVSGEELAKQAGSVEQAHIEGKAIELTSLSDEAAQAEVRALLDLPRSA